MGVLLVLLRGDRSLANFLTTHRILLVDLNRCAAALSACKTEDTFLTESINFCSPRAAYETFLDALKALKNDKLFYEWSGDLTDTFQKCSKTYEACKRLFCDGSDIKNAVDPPVCGNDSDIEPCDSASQVTSRYSLTSSKSSVVRRRIEVERRRAELDNMQELAKARARKRRLLAEVEAAAEKQRFEAEAEKQRFDAEAEKQRLQARAEKERVLAETEEAEILAKLRLESIKLKAEEELISCSEYGSSIASKSRSAKIKSCMSENREPFQKVNRLSFKPQSVLKSGSVNKHNSERQLNTNERDVSETKPSLLFDCPQSRGSVLGVTRQIMPSNFESKFVSETRCNDTLFDPSHNTNDVAHAGTVPQPGARNFNSFNPDSRMRNSVIATNELNWQTYLDRQSRNEYITLASQIAYDGSNTAFVFFENQIRRLMEESPIEKRRLEVLRASCVGQPREMVNLFCAPMKNMSTAQRIEKALDRLRQRYGISGGFSSEPKVRAVRHGPKVSFNATSLKSFNEDLNTLEVFAYAHDEVEKLSGQLLLDTASRLPNILKRRYLDYLDKMQLNLSQPGFESLRRFIVHEIDMATSDYAQAFFKHEEKEGSREPSTGTRDLRVRQVAVETSSRANNRPYYHTESKSRAFEINEKSRVRNDQVKSPPLCFVCSRPDSKHFLMNCDKFKALSLKEKRDTVIRAKRCLNCLSLEHFVRECSRPNKCRKCGPRSDVSKHATALHDCFASPNLGAAEKETRTQTIAEANSNDARNPTVLKLNSIDKRAILLRTSAVRVVNSDTGTSALAYAQLDTGSQVTLISNELSKELGLTITPDPDVSIRTLADQRVSSKGRTSFELESLFNGERFSVADALVVPQFFDNENTLPHAVDISEFEHFEGVEIPVAPGRDRVDVLIGQSHKSLLTVLEEREGAGPEEPNLVLTRLGPVASGGRVPTATNSYRTFKLAIQSMADTSCDCVKLKREIDELKAIVREYELQDECVQSSRTDELANSLVSPHINVVNEPYEMPVPFKNDILAKLPNNYVNALKRTQTLKNKAMKDPELRKFLINTFAELIDEGWIVPIDERMSDESVWYLPFFVTHSDKPRVVYDGAAEMNGLSLNSAVLAGENLLNNLVQVLTRFRLGKYACIADVGKSFLQVGIPVDQQDWFRIVWYKNNDLENGDSQIFRFTRHVWGINSSPYVALLALQRLAHENPSNASQITLNAVLNNRYMDDLLLASDTLLDLETVVEEGLKLFESRKFKLRKWIANSFAKSILLHVPECDLAPCMSEIDLGSQPLPNSKALGLVWDTEGDVLRVRCREFTETATKREMSSQLASQFDPLGMASPFLLGGKLILQKVSSLGLGWDETLPDEVRVGWRKWLSQLSLLNEFSIDRNCLPDLKESNSVVSYQLHGFCDASNIAYCCVVYLRSIVNGKPHVSFVLGKSRLVLTQQTNWVISRKELEAAKIVTDLMLLALEALRHLNCSIHFWTDSQVVLKWITNPDLHLARFVKRRVDKILRVTSPDAWKYISTSENPADVGTRETGYKVAKSVDLWLKGPNLLSQDRVDVSSPVVLAARVVAESKKDDDNGLDKLIATSRNLYTLKKRFAYLVSFAQFIVAKIKKTAFVKPVLNAQYLDSAYLKAVKYVQQRCFGAAIDSLRRGSPDDFDAILKRLKEKSNDNEKFNRRINELKMLRNLRPCVGSDLLFRVDGRLENADLPVDSKHPIILPGRHALTRLVVLDEHSNAGHAGPSSTLMKTRQRFWIIHGISSVKHYIAECSNCALHKAKPIRQLMADLPACRLTACNKPFKICGMDYLGYFRFRQNRSDCEAWGILFTCMCTRCIHVELVTSLDLNSFLMAFSRFVNLRGSVDTVFSDNGSTFCAASKQLPKLLQSTEFHNALRKSNINWTRIPPYAPGQGGSWESMVKLFKTALFRVLENTRRLPTLIELQTYFSDAVRIVNDRPLTTLSDTPNDLKPISPSSFLGQELAPNTPVGEFHEKGDLRKDYFHSANLVHRFWLGWMKVYLPSLQGRNKWRTLQENLTPGQLVLIGDAEDLSYKGAYRLGRIHCLHPQIRRGKEIVRRATVAVLVRNSTENNSSPKIEYVLRDLSKIAPV